jgi:hypothetical protein
MRARSISSRKASSTWPDEVSVSPIITPTLSPNDQRSGLSTCAITTTRPPWYIARWHDWRERLASSRSSGNAALTRLFSGCWRWASSNIRNVSV